MTKHFKIRKVTYVHFNIHVYGSNSLTPSSLEQTGNPTQPTIESQQMDT